MEQWHQANERLSILCFNLKGKGYNDCLYLNRDGRKTMKCGDMGDIGCRVCPSDREYWIEEMEV